MKGPRFLAFAALVPAVAAAGILVGMVSAGGAAGAVRDSTTIEATTSTTVETVTAETTTTETTTTATEETASTETTTTETTASTPTTTTGISPGGAAVVGAAAASNSSTDWGWIAFGILAAAVVIFGIVWWIRSRRKT